MNKKRIIQIFILVIIFLSMLITIFISRELFLSNNQTYEPSKSILKVKASQKTYSRFIALNKLPSPTPNEPTPDLNITEELKTPTPTSEISPSISNLESPTPTEIILAKAVTLTITPTEGLTSTASSKEETGIPASGFYQNLQWLFLVSILIIFFSFIL